MRKYGSDIWFIELVLSAVVIYTVYIFILNFLIGRRNK